MLLYRVWFYSIKHDQKMTTKYPSAKEFVRKIEERNATLPDDDYIPLLDGEESIIPVFITSYFILHQKRRIYNKQNKSNERMDAKALTEWDTNVRTNVLAPWMECNQYGIILAAILFYFNQATLLSKCKALKYVLNCSLNEESHTVSEMIKYLKDTKKIQDTALNSNVTTPIITALCLLSNYLNDSTLGALSSSLDFNTYTQIIIQKHNNWQSNAAVSSLIRQYLNQFVPKCDHDIKRKEIHDEFSLNSKDCLERLVSRFSMPITSTSTDNSNSIENEASYEIYMGPLNYWKNLSTKVKTIQDKTFIVVYYKSILYDVVAEDGKSLLNLAWSERLEKISNETHILVKQMLGTEIKDLIASRDTSQSLTITTCLPEFKSFHINITKMKASLEEVESASKKRKLSKDEEEL
jgi:hypothetical protein